MQHSPNIEGGGWSNLPSNKKPLWNITANMLTMQNDITNNGPFVAYIIIGQISKRHNNIKKN